jgi:hypothetical protein
MQAHHGQTIVWKLPANIEHGLNRMHVYIGHKQFIYAVVYGLFYTQFSIGIKLRSVQMRMGVYKLQVIKYFSPRK